MGAAELFRQLLVEHRPLDWLTGAWRGDFGEYPPLYPALVGAWWWGTGIGQPGRVEVRAVGLLWALLTALAMARLAARAGPDRRAASLAAFLFSLSLPMLNGLSRHFMPEAALTAAVSLSVLAAVRLGERPGLPRAALLGGIVGLGLLIKQTFPIYAALPVLVAAGRPRRTHLVALGVAASIAAPWYLGHLGLQLDYGAASAGMRAEGGPLVAAAFYPLVLGWEGWGPPLALGALVALGLALERGIDRRTMLGLAWLGGGALLLLLIPKKYPRLLLPLTPAAALWIGAVVARMPRTGRAVTALVGLCGGGWLFLASIHSTAVPALVDELDPGCAQRWLRAPEGSDLGLDRVAEAVRRAPPGPIAVIEGPQIPCTLQTTHPWIDHLGPYLRREGLEREVVEGPDPRAALTIDWKAEEGPGLPGGPSFMLRPRVALPVLP